jgi:Ca2+-binding RTX toxin-like protein
MTIINGTTGNDFLTGTAENDLMPGNAGDNTLIGGLGDDILVGGLGNNTLTGADGADTFVLNGTGSINGMFVQIRQITAFSASAGDTIEFHEPLPDKASGVPHTYKPIGYSWG